jgi:hypothetical protein
MRLNSIRSTGANPAQIRRDSIVAAKAGLHI